MQQPTQRQQAANMMASLATDYVNHLRKLGHNAAAIALQERANYSLSVLTADESSQQVPEAQD